MCNMSLLIPRAVLIVSNRGTLILLYTASMRQGFPPSIWPQLKKKGKGTDSIPGGNDSENMLVSAITKGYQHTHSFTDYHFLPFPLYLAQL